MVIKRGEIWWANLPEPTGSEPGYRRPILVIQFNDFNESKISTIIGIVITSNVRLAQAPGNVSLPQKATDLPKNSIANVSQVITVDKNFLIERVSILPSPIFKEIEEGLRLVMSL